MKFNKFEDIIAWKYSQELVTDIYQLFREVKDYSFKDQIQRAAISIMNNVAEGFERGGNKEFRKFLFIAKGSCAEVRSMLYIALTLRYIDKKKFDILFNKTVETSKVLSGLIKKL